MKQHIILFLFLLFNLFSCHAPMRIDVIMQPNSYTGDQLWFNDNKRNNDQRLQVIHENIRQCEYAQQLAWHREIEQYQSTSIRYALADHHFHQYYYDLSLHASSWQATNSKRYQAYCATVYSNDVQTTHAYTITSATSKILKQYGIVADAYKKFRGNELQHELMTEIIDGVTCASAISHHCIEPFDIFINEKAVHIFDDARQMNEIGDCINSSKLIDLSYCLLDYCFAGVQGVTHGAINGVIAAAVNTYRLIRHPIDSTKEIGAAMSSLAVQISSILYDYGPVLPSDTDLLTVQDCKDYSAACDRVAGNWRNAFEQLRMQWKENPQALVYTIANTGARVVMSGVVNGWCFNLLSQTANFAALNVGKLAKSTIAAGANAVRLLKIERATNRLIAKSEQFGFSKDSVCAALKNIGTTRVEGDILAFERAWCELEHVPGVSKVVKSILQHSAKEKELTRAKGFVYELEVASKLKELGHKIIALGENIGGHEIDISTASRLIECKNIHWEFYIGKTNDLLDMQKKLIDRLNEAQKTNRTFVLVTKKSIPLELAWFKNSLLSKGSIILTHSDLL